MRLWIQLARQELYLLYLVDQFFWNQLDTYHQIFPFLNPVTDIFKLMYQAHEPER
jgi:hypothetical protein